MKTAVQIVSWVSVVIGVLAVIGGFSQLVADPTSAYYSLVGGALFATQGIVSLFYVGEQTKKPF